MRFRSVFRIPAGLTTATHRQGIHDSVTFNDANDGIYLEVASYTARFKSAASGTRTTNGTTATLLADTWYTAHIWFVTTTTARCVITQDNGTVALDVTNTTNVPGNSRVARASFVATNTPAATADLVYVDSVGIGYSAI
jgi:hypothetical protein